MTFAKEPTGLGCDYPPWTAQLGISVVPELVRPAVCPLLIAQPLSHSQ